ncbi:hypothetical protein ACP4OV_022200 [Aristida adscensionis]
MHTALPTQDEAPRRLVLPENELTGGVVSWSTSSSPGSQASNSSSSAANAWATTRHGAGTTSPSPVNSRPEEERGFLAQTAAGARGPGARPWSADDRHRPREDAAAAAKGAVDGHARTPATTVTPKAVTLDKPHDRGAPAWMARAAAVARVPRTGGRGPEDGGVLWPGLLRGPREIRR